MPCRETQSYFILFFFLKIRSSVIRSHLSGHRQTLAAPGEKAIGGEPEGFLLSPQLALLWGGHTSPGNTEEIGCQELIDEKSLWLFIKIHLYKIASGVLQCVYLL